MLGVTLLASALFWRDSLAEVKSGVLASALYVQNWWLIFHDQNYFASTGRPPPLQHVWSLAIEEQFYLLWPPIVLLIALWLAPPRAGRRRARRDDRRARVGACWMAVLAIHGNVPFDTDASRLYFGTDTHASGLLLGCAAAALVASRSRVRQTARTPRSRIGDVARRWPRSRLFVWVLFARSEFDPGLYRGGFLAAAALCTVVVVAATRRGSLLGRALDNAADALGRQALVRDLPVALARLRRHAARARHRVPRSAAPLFVPRARDRRRDRRALVPLPRAADPPRGLPAVAPARHRRVTGARRACGGRRSCSPRSALVAAVAFGFARAPVEGSAAQSPVFDAARERPASAHPIKAVTPTKPPAGAHQAGSGLKPLNRLHVTAIGDSVLESAAPAMRLVFPFLTVDADVGRQANEVFDEIAWLQLGQPARPDRRDRGRLERHRQRRRARRLLDEARRAAAASCSSTSTRPACGRT